MPANPFDSPKEIQARMTPKKSAGLLDALRTPAKPKGGNKHGFIVTPSEDAAISRGETPSTFSRDKDGNLRAKVQ